MRTLIPIFALLAACGEQTQSGDDWLDDQASIADDGYPGIAPVPNSTMSVHIDRILQGWPMELVVNGAPATATIGIAYGLQGTGAGPCPAALGGLCFDLPNAKVLCTAQVDPVGNAGCAVGTVPPAARWTGQQICFQPYYQDGTSSLLGTTTCGTLEKPPTPLVLTPDPLELEVAAGESNSALLTIENLVPVHLPFTLTTTCPSTVTFETGAGTPMTGTAPALGLGQLLAKIDATNLTASSFSCDLTLTPTNTAAAPTVLPVDVTVKPPGITVTIPPSGAAPLNLGGSVGVRVTLPGGAPAVGYPVTFTILSGTCPASFQANTSATYGTVTSAHGTAVAIVAPDPGCTGNAVVSTSVSDPLSGTSIGSGTTTLSWAPTPGNIYYWNIHQGTGTILTLPANYTLPPVAPVNYYTGATSCTGCHAPSPVAVPGAGVPLMAATTFGPYPTLKISDGAGAHLQTVQASPSYATGASQVSWKPDASALAYHDDRSILVWDVASASSHPVATGSLSNNQKLFPTYSSDGSHIAYAQNGAALNNVRAPFPTLNVPGVVSIDVVPAAGGPATTLVPAEPGKVLYYPKFSPDGRWLAFNKSNDTSYSSLTAELWIVPVNAAGSQTTGPARRLDNLNYVDGVWASASWPTWAPDSSWIAFARATTSADWDVYLAAIDAAGNVSPPVALPPAATSTGSEHLPTWAP